MGNEVSAFNETFEDEESEKKVDFRYEATRIMLDKVIQQKKYQDIEDMKKAFNDNLEAI